MEDKDLDLADKIKVMDAYNNGNAIQYKSVADYDDLDERYDYQKDWTDCPDPVWNWQLFEYRIKPENRIRPYKNAVEFMDAMRVHGPYLRECDIALWRLPITVGDDCISLYDSLKRNAVFTDFNDLIKYRWSDGTECGFKEEVKLYII